MFQLSVKQLVESSGKYIKLLFWHVHKTTGALTLCVQINYKSENDLTKLRLSQHAAAFLFSLC